jgi:tetratricopeptide (TPR) repeat protein
MNNHPADRSEDELTARKAIDLNPGSASAYYDLGYVLSQEPARAGEAKTAFQKAIALDPNNPRYSYRQWARKDPDLASIQEDPRFHKIVG